MGQDGRPGAANILRHADLRTVHLSLAAFAAQLLDYLHDLIHARRADGVAPGF